MANGISKHQQMENCKKKSCCDFAFFFLKPIEKKYKIVLDCY